MDVKARSAQRSAVLVQDSQRQVQAVCNIVVGEQHSAAHWQLQYNSEELPEAASLGGPTCTGRPSKVLCLGTFDTSPVPFLWAKL